MLKPNGVENRVNSGWNRVLTLNYERPYEISRLGFDLNGQAVDGDEYEFLELKNVGTNTLNLGGMQFTAGITFVFTNGTRLAPSQFFVLARNPARFTERYPGMAVNGVYAGKLDNGGETLRLAHVLGTPAVSVTYNDRAPWPVTPDGYGYSLVPVNPEANPRPGRPLPMAGQRASGRLTGNGRSNPNHSADCH